MARVCRKVTISAINDRVSSDLACLYSHAGSTEIMLRSKAKGLAASAITGQRFGGDGDFFGVAYNGDNPLHSCGRGDHPLADMKGKEVSNRPVVPLVTIFLAFAFMLVNRD